MADCLYLALVYCIVVVLVGCSKTSERPYVNTQSLETRQGDIWKKNKTSPSSKSSGCPKDFYEHSATSACYRIVSEGKNWFDARESCIASGANLIWIESKMEYRHIVIKLLTLITASKDKYVGYWTGANDIVDEKMYFWGDSDMPVMSTFFRSANMPQLCRSYCSFRSRQPSSSTAEELQKHCVGLTYVRATMRMSQAESECDGKMHFICKCKTNGDNPSALCGRD